MKLKLIVEMIYEAIPEYYETDDPVEAAAIDQKNFKDDPGGLYDLLDTGEYTVSVHPVYEEGK